METVDVGLVPERHSKGSLLSRPVKDQRKRTRSSAMATKDSRKSCSDTYRGVDRPIEVRNEEKRLVESASAGDQEAFAKLYDRFVNKIYKYIYYKIGSSSDAEDLTAQVFLKAWEAIGKYMWTERPFSAWLYRIAHNLVVDYFRTKCELTPLDDLPTLEERGPSPEDVTQRHLTADALRRAITRLTPDQQHVVILRFLEGYPTEQVAEILGKQPGAVRTLQHRALVALSGVFRRGAERL